MTTNLDAVGDDAVKFLNQLTLVGDYLGKPFRTRPWQEAIVRPLFRLRADGLRQYKQAFLALPRKQAKTTLVAGAAGFLLFGECRGRKGKQIYSASGDHKQAALIFSTLSSMIRANKTLSSLTRIYETTKRIVVPSLENSYEALSSEAGLKHGLAPSEVLFDEVHVLPNRDLHDALVTGFGARIDPLTVYITTAGYDRQSLCYELWDYARKVRDGVIDDPAFLPVIYEAGPDEDWTSEEVWHRVMPALGDYCQLEFIREECRRAKELPAYENTFRQLYLNQWTEQSERWIPVDAWNACADELDVEDYRGESCWIGVDLSTTNDLTAVVVVFENALGGVVAFPWFFVPEEGARKRERRDRVPYLTWARSGHLTLTPGDVVDYQAVRHLLQSLAARFDVRGILCDPWNATGLLTQLRDEDGLPVEVVRQGFASLTAPSKEFEKQVVAKTLRHDGNPVMRWCVSNVAVEKDAAGNLKPSKKKSIERIDGVAALINAMAGWLTATPAFSGNPLVLL